MASGEDGKEGWLSAREVRMEAVCFPVGYNLIIKARFPALLVLWYPAIQMEPSRLIDASNNLDASAGGLQPRSQSGEPVDRSRCRGTGSETRSACIHSDALATALVPP